MPTPSPLVMPPASFLYGTMGGVVLHIICFRLSPILTSRLGSKSFQRRVASLKDGKLYDYHALLPSTIHAIVQLVGTYSIVFHGREIYDRDILADGAAPSSPALIFDDRTIVPYGATRLGPTVYMGVFVGYLVADALSAPSLEALGYPFAVHHVAAAACWSLGASARAMQPVACLLQFNELSTPLMNARQYLLTAGYRSSDLPVALCSLVFFAAFGLVRVAPLPFVVRDWVTRDFGAVRDVLGMGCAVLFSLFFVVNALLQCGWFFMMCRKIVRMIRSKPKEKAH